MAPTSTTNKTASHEDVRGKRPELLDDVWVSWELCIRLSSPLLPLLKYCLSLWKPLRTGWSACCGSFMRASSSRGHTARTRQCLYALWKRMWGVHAYVGSPRALCGRVILEVTRASASARQLASSPEQR